MKSKLFRLFALLMLVSMTLSLSNPASAQPALQTGVNTPAAESAQPPVAKIGESETGLYIVRLADPALASYLGGIAGLEATSPMVTGARKLDAKSEASVAYLSYLDAKQAELITEINGVVGRSVEVVFQYKNALNGIAVRVSQAEAQQLAGLPTVKAVYPDMVRQVETDIGPWWINADDIWEGDIGSGLSTKGEGIIVGVIDTGINHASPSFADPGPIDGYDHTNPWGAGNYVGICNPADPNYIIGFCNDKLIGAFNFTDAPSAEDDHGHGSHTASTAAGNVVTVTISAEITRTISGVAPHANIIAYRGLNTAGSGNSTTLVASVDQGIADGVDVLNYSISGGDDPWNDPIDLAFLDAYNAGIFVSASAGNTGPNPNTVAKTGPWNAAVGMSTTPRLIANSLDVTNPFTATLQDLAALQGNGPQLTTDIAAELAYSPANVIGCTSTGGFPAGYFTGKFALIMRGTCSFSEKIVNATTAGAVAVVMFNNRGGPPIAMSTPGTTIPSVMVGQGDGLDLIDYIDANAPVTVRLNFAQSVIVNPDFADIMDSGSSRGPSDWEVLKPDYAAPGVNILAAVAASGGDPVQYAFYSGTSMAAPHGAGAAALMIDLHPDWSPAEIKSALQTTTFPWWLMSATTASSVVAANPFDTGSGRLDLEGAANAGLVFDETFANYVAANPTAGGDPKTLNQPNLVNYNCVGTCTWTRTVRSVLSTSATYTVTFVSDVPTLTVTANPDVFTINPGATQEIEFTASVVGLPLDVFAFGDVLFETNATFPGESPLPNESFTDVAFPPTGWATFRGANGLGIAQDWVRTTTTPNTAPAAAFVRYEAVSGGLAQDWLVTPQFMPTASASTLQFYARESYTADYGTTYTIRVSTASQITPTDFTVVQTYGETFGTTYSQYSVDLSAYVGQNIYVAFVMEQNDGDNWFVDDVNVIGAGAPVADQRLTTVVAPASAYVPDTAVINTDLKSGSQIVPDLQVGAPVITLTATVDGLTPATVISEEVPQDPTTGSPYNGDGGTVVQLITVPAGALRLVAEIVASTSLDVDMWMGTGSTPGTGIACTSATGAVLEYCNIDNPAPGNYWVLAQNFASSTPGGKDVISLSFGVVLPGDVGDLTVSGPTAVPAGMPFDIALNWDEPLLSGVDAWYGVVTLGTEPASPDDIGQTRVNLHYFQPVLVSKDAPATAMPGEVITYTIVLDGNGSPIADPALLTDTLPAGVEFAGGLSATYGNVSYSTADNTVYWDNGVIVTAVRPNQSTAASSVVIPGLTVNSLSQAANTPFAPEAVLWNQTPDGSGNGIVSDFILGSGFGSYSADDFINTQPWLITEIYMGGFVNLNDLATNATDLNWYIYADNGGEPAGVPGDGNEIWSYTTVPTDTAVTIVNNSPTLDIVAANGAPLALDPGHYWITFFPSVQTTGNERWNWYRSSQTSGNGEDAMLVDEGNFVPGGIPWTPITDLVGPPGYYDLVYSLSGDINVPDLITVTFNVTVTEPGVDITNVADFMYNGDLFSAEATTSVPSEVTFIYHDLENEVPDGEVLHMAGNFNGWSTTATPMLGDGSDDTYTATLYMDTPYSFEYKYVIGNSWDNHAGDRLNSVNRNTTVNGNAIVDDYRLMPFGYAKLNGDGEITISLGDPTGIITGEVFLNGVTNFDPISDTLVEGMLGYGTSADVNAWTWVPITVTHRLYGANDVFAGEFTPMAVGVYSYTVRFEFDGFDPANPNITDWYYGDLDGVHPGDPFELDQTGVLTVLAATADLEVTKTGPDHITGGENITYTIVVNNLGPADATGVVVTDTLPAGVTFVSASVGCDETAGVVVCDVGTIANGDDVTITIVVTAPKASVSLVNNVEVASDNDDNLENNTDVLVTDVIWYKLFLPIVMKAPAP